ncbi:MAG: DsbA family protein [Alphaproteobacteria bacterium]|jgi:2-hydroxychromene-2-carboxylate isomerase
MAKTVDLWLDLRSPYSFLAKDPAYALEKELDVTLRLRPFALNLAGVVNLNDPAALANGLRKVKYLYADARRFAGPRGITLLGPKKIFDQKLVHLAWLFAEKSGKDRALIDLAYPRFFKRELDYEDRGAVGMLLKESGVDPAGFDAFASGEGPKELAAHQQEAEAQGVFAVPTFVVDGELFWGQDRIDFVRAKLSA